MQKSISDLEQELIAAENRVEAAITGVSAAEKELRDARRDMGIADAALIEARIRAEIKMMQS